MNDIALQAADGLPVTIADVTTVQPLDEALLSKIESPVLTLEENVVNGGFGCRITEYFNSRGLNNAVKVLGAKDGIVPHATVSEQLEMNGLDSESVRKVAEQMLKNR